MGRSNVRAYTDQELLDAVSKCTGFKGFPQGYWGIGVQSKEDAFDKFDDKFYLFNGTKFVMVSDYFTTNAGKSGLLGYDQFGLEGTAVWKTNVIYYDLFKQGLHKGKMEAYRQDKPIYYYRDSDKDKKAEEQGDPRFGVIYANLHGSTYEKGKAIVKENIGGWSIACQVFGDNTDYEKFLEITKNQKLLSYALIKES